MNALSARQACCGPAPTCFVQLETRSKSREPQTFSCPCTAPPGGRSEDRLCSLAFRAPCRAGQSPQPHPLLLLLAEGLLPALCGHGCIGHAALQLCAQHHGGHRRAWRGRDCRLAPELDPGSGRVFTPLLRPWNACLSTALA